MKRILVLLASMALVASGLQMVPAVAAEAPEIPATVQVDDPLGDANGVNDQDTTGTPASGQGDNVGPAGGTATDLLKVWFSHTATDVSLHFQTKGDPNTLAYDTYFRFASNPGTGPVAANEARGCLYWIASVNGAAGAYVGETGAVLEDQCNVGDGVAGTLATAAGPDETFITSMTFPRSYSPLLVDGGKIVTPYGVSRVVYAGPIPSYGTAAVVTLDNTKRGTDYELAAATPAKPTKPVKPAKPAKPVKPTTPVKNGCDNGKGKKKGCTKTPPSQACAPFTPGEAGADKPTVTLTDAATEAAPVEQKVTTEASIGDLDQTGMVDHGSFDHFNIQVDSAAAEAGVYALIEFPARNDVDLNLLHPDGSYAARSRAWNTFIELNEVKAPVINFGISTTGHGGESSATSEKLVWIKTSDCGGWTMEVGNWLGQGGEMTVKLWLGEAKIDPQEEGAETP